LEESALDKEPKTGQSNHNDERETCVDVADKDSSSKETMVEDWRPYCKST